MRRFFSLGEAGSVRATVCNGLFWWLTLLYMEVVLHVVFFGGFTASGLYIVGFTGVIALIISGLLGFLPVRTNKIISMVLVCVIDIIFCTQIVYEAAFGTMYAMSQIAMGGAAVTSFWRETLLTILKNIHILALMLLPIPVTAVLLKKTAVFAVPRNWLRLAVLLLAALAQFVTVSCLPIGGTGDYTSYYFYYSDRATTDQTANRFGLLTTMRLEFFGDADPEQSSQEKPPELVQPVQPVIPDTTDPTGPQQDQPEERYNILEIDFDYLNTHTDDPQILALNQYIASLPGTKQNEYTGMLSDYNLITICAESFSEGAIHEQLTPTLYKLVNEGFVFNNYYNAYPNNTTDGEYSFCLGLWPDTTRGKNASSFYASRGSYLPYSLGKIFREQREVNTYGYHNFLGSYYGRDETYPNMGYDSKFFMAGMTFSSSWPSSDLEMMEQSIGDYIHSGEQFHAYYMSFSGHMSYDTASNKIAEKNYHLVKDLPISEPAKCYLACNIELDRALQYLLEELDKAGILEKTAIVVAGDHHPYGLKDHRYAQLLDHELTEQNKYEAPLIFWVGGMKEPVYVDTYMCNIDILPTILNLWGFQYDSRLLSGTDALSDGTHIAVLRDQSFFTDKVWFNASTGTATWFVDESAVEPGYLENHIRMVQNQFAFSSNILNTAYYNFLFEKGNVKLNHKAWGDINNPGGKAPEKVPEETIETVPEETTEKVPEETTENVPEETTGKTPEETTGQTPETPDDNGGDTGNTAPETGGGEAPTPTEGEEPEYVG